MSKPVLKGQTEAHCASGIYRVAAAKKGKRNWVKAPADFGDMLGSQVLWVDYRS